MNKQQLIEIIAEENEITKDMATRTLNTMIRSIMTSVKNGEPVVLVGFGTFRHTGEKLELKPRSVPKFVPGTLFKQIVDEQNS